MPTPLSLDALRPDQPLHNTIRQLVRSRMDFSLRYMNSRFSKWDEVDEIFRAFRSEDEDDASSKEKHGVVKIVVPYTFATHQTMSTFLLAVLAGEKPTLRVEGRGPEDVKPARGMEIVLDWQYEHNVGYLKFHHWFSDGLRYGVGILNNSWDRQYATIRESFTEPRTLTLLGRKITIGGTKQQHERLATVFEGNIFDVVDPRLFRPDPRVPLHRIQQGEFCGHVALVPHHALVKGQKAGDFFNVELIPRTVTEQGVGRSQAEGTADRERLIRADRPQWGEQPMGDAKSRGFVKAEVLVAEIIPRDYDLSNYDMPQKWLFTLANDSVVIQAEPFKSGHGKYPYLVVETYPDGHTTQNPGVVEVVQGLQDHLSWLFNSRMANVRKVINNFLVIDPSRINTKDVVEGFSSAGTVARLLQRAYGTNPRDAVHQVVVSDVTSGHLGDAKVVIDLIQRVTAATDNLMGLELEARRTATEVQAIQRLAASRMKMMASLFSAQGVAPLTAMMAMNTQEFLSEKQWFRVLGSFARQMGDKAAIEVGPDELQGSFDYPVAPGVLPTDRIQLAEVWREIFKTVATSEILMQVFDIIPIFREAAQLSGAKNIEEFVRQGGGMPQVGMEVRPDEEVASGVARGNLVPLPRRREPEGAGIRAMIEGGGGPRPTEMPSGR